MARLEGLKRMGELATWYMGKPGTYSTNPKGSEIWEELWEKRKPRLIPINTDGPSRLAQFAIDTHLKERSNFRPKTMVEIGSGPGSRSIQLARKYGLQLHLLDTSFNALHLHAQALAKEAHYDESVCPVKGSMLEAPFSDNSFDVTFAFGPHDHFFGKKRQIAFDEMCRITASGGIAINILPSQFNPFYTAEMISKVLDNTWEFGPTKHFTPNEFIFRMKKAGFKEVKLYGASFFTSWLRLLPKSEQVKRYDNPTSSKSLNRWLSEKDMNFTSLLNRYFGGDMMAIGVK